MNLTGRVLRVYVPEFVRRRALLELFAATADAFGAAMPALSGRSGDELLERFADFTARQATAALRRGDELGPIREKLYGSAHATGARLRHELGITTTSDAMEAARVLYRMLRIDFRQTRQGAVRIDSCYFSRFYSPRVCGVMSALDQGLLAGLSGGGRLEFRRRITEGAPYCAAAFAEARA